MVFEDRLDTCGRSERSGRPGRYEREKQVYVGLMTIRGLEKRGHRQG